MATSYPARLDALRRIAATLSGPPYHTDVEDDQSDAIEAIEEILGVNPQGASPSVASRFGRLDFLVNGLNETLDIIAKRVWPANLGGTGLVSPRGWLRGNGASAASALTGAQVLADLGFRWGGFDFTWNLGQRRSVVNTIMLDRPILWCDVQVATSSNVTTSAWDLPNEPGSGHQGFYAVLQDEPAPVEGATIPARYFALVEPKAV